MLSLLRAEVRSLVGELRSTSHAVQPKKKKKDNELIKLVNIEFLLDIKTVLGSRSVLLHLHPLYSTMKWLLLLSFHCSETEPQRSQVTPPGLQH